MKNVIFDLDGTLALCDHRRHYVECAVKNWDAFFAECDRDTVNEPIARLFRFYRDSPLHRVWILSGRSGTEETAGKTFKWLNENNLLPSEIMRCHDEITYLFQMRKHGDRRPDVEVKLEMIRQHGLTPENTEVVFDDRNCMVNAWRLWGFQCCQVAEGDF
ncbi:HAD-like domain protein [Vibrio phage 1.271.B._10N.286.54.B4]|nr:HAD-like domain protein [Vibrio phage 1.027.O._10N.286.54.B8]AUR92382.1 HAD-like domain protein [Vibrio phage 1.171.O._10N.261.52.F12]AUR94435.1 HAD-like domain protein [Vibrio phage 1.194.O._10N.286.54.B1]AUR94608.1 HAD-like domain protein [Vibrio phage 1.196.O._10N.286.54.E12]AUR95075.1 HAD-like domain protein [Vibrio phage 1.200.O._10N.286.55.E1]AUR99563.1 HAD-like domain protein [Vibrio phage 1.267.O._10N.286.54.A1]AUR99648.1 HAD-like domain protein [Vibrio phage 1.268.A._10N.286.54.A1